jgi:hypothetical protein
VTLHNFPSYEWNAPKPTTKWVAMCWGEARKIVCLSSSRIA